MIPTVVVLVLACIALVLVIVPLRRGEAKETNDLMAELEEKKTVALNAILDLESERDVGKLTEQDFNELRAVYEAEALDLIHKLDGVEDAVGPDPLEREIALARKRLGNS